MSKSSNSKIIKAKINLWVIFKTVYIFFVFIILMIIDLFIFVPPILLLNLIFPKLKLTLYTITKISSKVGFILTFFLFKYDTNIKDLPKSTGNRIYIINHLSSFDVILLFFLQDKIKILVKEKYTRVPLLGHIIKLSGNIILKETESIYEQTDISYDVVRELTNGGVIAIFPEGTRSKNSNIARFKKGAFRIAYEAKSEIVPVVLDSWNIIRPGNSVWVFDTKLVIRVLPPYKYEDYKNIDSTLFAKNVRISMIKELLDIRESRKKNEKKYYRNNEIFNKLDEEARNEINKASLE